MKMEINLKTFLRAYKYWKISEMYTENPPFRPYKLRHINDVGKELRNLNENWNEFWNFCIEFEKQNLSYKITKVLFYYFDI